MPRYSFEEVLKNYEVTSDGVAGLTVSGESITIMLGTKGYSINESLRNFDKKEHKKLGWIQLSSKTGNIDFWYNIAENKWHYVRYTSVSKTLFNGI